MIHPFPLNLNLGTLVVDLGCFPFDYETYLTQSDSRKTSMRHSEFDRIWYTVKRPPPFSALPPLDYSEASPKAISMRTSYMRVRLEFHR